MAQIDNRDYVDQQALRSIAYSQTIPVGGSEATKSDANSEGFRSYPNKLIYTTNRYPWIMAMNNDKDRYCKKNEDMKSGDKREDELKDVNKNLLDFKDEKPEELLRLFREEYEKLFISDPNLQTVFGGMIKHFSDGKYNFKKGYIPDYAKEFSEICNEKDEIKEHRHRYIDFKWENERSDYENRLLTNAISEHRNTRIYTNAFKEAFESELDKCKDNYKKIEMINVERMRKQATKITTLNFALDVTSGLKALINEMWATRIEVQNLHVNTKTKIYSCTYKFTFFDHFGLNDSDISYYKLQSSFSVFYYWYILQRYIGGIYRPFITRATIYINVKDENYEPIRRLSNA